MYLVDTHYTHFESSSHATAPFWSVQRQERWVLGGQRSVVFQAVTIRDGQNVRDLMAASWKMKSFRLGATTWIEKVSTMPDSL